MLTEYVDSKSIVVCNPTTKEKVYVDGRKIDDNSLIGHIRMGAYYILPNVVYYLDFTDWQDFESTISTAKILLGYENEDIHVIIDRSVDDSFNTCPDIIQKLMGKV